jgi:redox-sensitive bicupin YhaK (pirin superfamily)
MTILDVSLAKGASFSVDLEANINAFILSHAGSGATGVDDEHPVGLDDAVVYERDQAAEGTNGIKVSAPTEDLKFILFAAVPLNEPIVSGGPFIGGSREQIEMYYAKFRNGEMGSMERSEDSY